MNETGYISRQIAVYKTDKKLVELTDKLNPAPLELYAHIHAHGDDNGAGQRIYSNIGVVVQDYSAGTGANTKRASANLQPDEVQFIFSRVQNCVESFEFHYVVEYESDHSLVTYVQSLLEDFSIMLSNHDTEMTDITVNGYPGTMTVFTTEGVTQTTIIWHDNEYVYRMSSNLSYEELIRVAETVK